MTRVYINICFAGMSASAARKAKEKPHSASCEVFRVIRRAKATLHSKARISAQAENAPTVQNEIFRRDARGTNQLPARGLLPAARRYERRRTFRRFQTQRAVSRALEGVRIGRSSQHFPSLSVSRSSAAIRSESSVISTNRKVCLRRLSAAETRTLAAQFSSVITA